MALKITYSVNISFIGDGTGGMFAPQGTTIQFTQSSAAGTGQVPGGNTPTAANLLTACVAMGADIGAQMGVAAVVARIQGLATGGS